MTRHSRLFDCLAVTGALLFGPACLIAADLVINEVQTSNAGALRDEDNDSSDWIELLNRGPEPVNLAGWGLSDRTDTPMKWRFPSWTLEPGKRLLVFASGKDRTNVQDIVMLDSPQDVSGLVLWLRADNAGYSAGSSIPVWPDLSGAGKHATQTVVTAQPVLAANAVNGRSAVRFTHSSSQQLLLPAAGFNGMTSLRDFSIFMVCRWGGKTTSGLFGAWGGLQNSHFEINANGELRLRVAALDSIRSAGTMTKEVWSQVAGLMNSAGDTPIARLFRDGILRGSMERDPGAALLTGYTTMAIGNSDSNTRFFDGDIAEVVIFNRALPNAERHAVERHLASYYGLPYPNEPPVPELHANFSLSADGEPLLLTRPDGVLADAVTVPALPSGASYGRMPDGSGAFAYFAQPTPGAANTSQAYGPPVDLPRFSHERGIHDAPFTLTISHDDPGTAVYCTLDGSVPAATHGFRYTGPLAIGTTTVVRAVAVKEGALPTRSVVTHTYLFLDSVLAQTNRPAGYPADWNGYAYTSYVISTNAAAQPGHAEALRRALQAVPVLALTASVDDLFGSGGVYANPEDHKDVERGVSAEWLTNGVGQVQVDAALRVQGGASRLFSNTPKKSLRLLFKDAYGPGRLKVPVLAEGGTPLADFNTLILRAEYNNAWTHTDASQRPRGTNMRDQWIRNTQVAISGVGSHGNHVHLFLNGLYWGLYNVSERPDAAFAASCLGGEREDYDAMTPDGIRDGDNVAWNAMHNIAKAGVSTRESYEAISQYLAIDHLIDYMLINFYAGNNDWPHHNWNAVRRREAGAGYLFFCWDSERTLESVADNKTGATHTAGPAYLHTALCANAEYRLRFADRAHRALFNDGALTPANAAASFAALAARVEPAIYGEAVRWGAYRRDVTPATSSIPRYGTNEWAAERAWLLSDYFPSRTSVFVGHLRDAGLYPSVAAPTFTPHGGTLAYGTTVGVSAPQGTVYVTFDGSDPRVAFSGGVSDTAVACGASVTVTNAGAIKARALNQGVWSALCEASFSLVYPEPAFLPAGDGVWQVATNWQGHLVPDGAGTRVRIPAAAGRTVMVQQAVTVGRITFEQNGAAVTRLRDASAGCTVHLDGGADGNACIRVTGSGSGWVEFTVESGCVLHSPLELDIANLDGDDEYGALRLRESWSGPGGVIKRGVGMASLTGDGKTFTGEVVVEEGVLSVTGPAAPPQAAGVRVQPGGQVRMTSGSSGGMPRAYALGGTVTIEGLGRDAALPDGAGLGKSGALRYDPGGQGNQARVSAPLRLVGDAGVHVEGAGNALQFTGTLEGGRRLVKSGAGTLMLPFGTALTAAVEVANGTLSFTGSASLGALSGTGAVRVEGGNVITVPSAGGVVIEAVLQQAGDDARVNGVLRTAAISGALGGLRLYVSGSGTTFRGALFAPLDAGLAAAVRSAPQAVYVPDAAGEHQFGGTRWRPAADAQVVTVPVRVAWNGAEEGGRVVEVRFGAAPASYRAWREQMFVTTGERDDESVAGPWATPAGDGIANLTRYVLGMGWDTPAALRYPRCEETADGWAYRFPYDPGRDDVTCVVEASSNLRDWNAAQRLFDSRSDLPVGLDEGWLILRDPVLAPQRFYRLRLEWDGP